MSKKVTIPLTLLKNLIALLECWDVSLYDRGVKDDYWAALWALKMKLLNLDIREAYEMISNAPNEETRHMASVEYLRLKKLLEINLVIGHL